MFLQALNHIEESVKKHYHNQRLESFVLQLSLCHDMAIVVLSSLVLWLYPQDLGTTGSSRISSCLREGSQVTLASVKLRKANWKKATKNHAEKLIKRVIILIQSSSSRYFGAESEDKLTKETMEAAEMAQLLQVVLAFPGALSSIFNTHVVAFNCLQLELKLSCGVQTCMQSTHVHKIYN